MTENRRSILAKAGKFTLTVDTEEEQFELLRAIARSESIAVRGIVRTDFLALFKHPLPPSDHRSLHLQSLRYVLSCRLENQAVAAIGKGDAWTLEEVYMRGAPVDNHDRSGFTPLHIACRGNQIECVMVLLNIGVDINKTSVAGYTPLYLSVACNSKAAEQLLRENGAMMVGPDYEKAPLTILDNLGL